MLDIESLEGKKILKEIAESVRRHIVAKTSKLFALYYSNKKEEVERELSKLRQNFNATAFFRTSIKNLFERKKPDVISFRISFPIKINYKNGVIYPIAEGEAVLDSSGRYKIVSSLFTLVYDDKKSNELEIVSVEISNFPKNIKDVLSAFINILMCSSLEELKEIIPSWK